MTVSDKQRLDNALERCLKLPAGTLTVEDVDYILGVKYETVKTDEFFAICRLEAMLRLHAERSVGEDQRQVCEADRPRLLRTA